MSAAGDGCPLCHAIGRPFVRRSRVPVHQNQLCGTVGEARGVVVGDLRICHCPSCDFVWNAAFDPELLSYHHGYDNTQTCSLRFTEHLGSLVALLVNEHGLRGRRIVEVGCGNGEFLRRLVLADAGNSGTGFDPSYRGPLRDIDGRLVFERSFFGADEASGSADAVVSRHVIEHVNDPLTLLELMGAAVASAPDPHVFIETPDVGWILRRRVVWDFFYEHCSYFSPRSIDVAARMSGLDIVGLDLVFGGQYLWAQARPMPGPDAMALQDTASIAEAAEGFERAERRLWDQLSVQLQQLAARGPVAVWGAGAKGVTYVNQLDAGAQMIDCVVDLNPAKQDGYLPGTGHAILSPEAAEARRIVTAVVLNPNYEQEIRELLARSHFSIDVVLADELGVVR